MENKSLNAKHDTIIRLLMSNINSLAQKYALTCMTKSA